MGGWVVLPFNNSTLLCKCAQIIWCTEKTSAPMGRVKTLKNEQLSIVVPTVHTPLNHLCTGLTTLYDFLYLIKPLHRKRKIYLSVLTWSPCWDWFCQCFFLSQTMTHWFLVFPILTFSIGFFSFFRFCDAPCEKEETAFICASNGSLYRFYCSQRLRDFQNIFSKDQNQEQMRDVTRALWSPCLPGGRNFFLPYSSTSLNKCGVCKMMLVECAVFARLDFYSTYLVSASLLRSRGFRELNRLQCQSTYGCTHAGCSVEKMLLTARFYPACKKPIIMLRVAGG